MDPVPIEEQYETDTIFSQDGDLPDSYLQAKLKDVESDNDIFSDSENHKERKTMDYYKLVSDDDDSDDELAMGDFLTINSATPTLKYGDKSHFKKLVDESRMNWNQNVGDSSLNFDAFLEDNDLYDVTKDSFRYGRVTTGTSYNLITGRMQDNVLEEVKMKDNENDITIETITEDESTHRITTEVKIPLAADDKSDKSFHELYDSQMPKYFDYRQVFPQVNGIWTILMDQNHHSNLSTFELQASICAALNSKRLMMMCIGVDTYNTITGVEMSPADRVKFRMALTRAVAGEFQPHLIKIPPKQHTGVSPLKRDVSELTTIIDVLFIPVFNAPDSQNRFLIVVRVKELSEKLHQLSSGRIYMEDRGTVVELSCIDEAFRVLILEKEKEKIPSLGSMFMREPDDIVEDTDSETSEESDEEEETNESIKMNVVSKSVSRVAQKDGNNVVTLKARESQSFIEKHFSDAIDSVTNVVEHERVQQIAWIGFAVGMSYAIIKYFKQYN